ncbi:hypothetical protein FQN51_004191 [Onygenales sp. PD_10]|nr:hypothetical protein FQN51_004191 [Onygenales sp. PD_10]
MENITFVCKLIVNLHLQACIKSKDILVLVSYCNQFHAYIAALNELRLMNPIYEGLAICTINAFQGSEHSIVIVDLVVAKSINFVWEYNYLNVILSCVINACYVICNLDAIKNMQNHHSAHAFIKIVSYFK